MNRCRFLGQAAAKRPHNASVRWVLTLWIIASLVCASVVAGPPNIVLLLVDDLGWTDTSTGLTCGGHGSDFYETPHIDALARAGICFSSAYSNGPNCAPSRAALFSGQWAARTGVYTVGKSNRGPAAVRQLSGARNSTTLAADTVTLAETLREAGYRCVHAGKWHLGDDPCEQGFELNLGGDTRGHPRRQFADQTGGGWEYPNLPPNNVAGEWLDDRLTRDALSHLATIRDQPFFLSLCFYGVHTPINAPEEDQTPFLRKAPGNRHAHATYAGYIKSVDDNVGRVLQFLEATDDPRAPGKPLLDNTIICFTSDNGGLGGFRALDIVHREITTQVPLSGGKGTLYEGGIRVPLIVRWDRQLAAGRVETAPVQLLDLYPTFCEAAKVVPKHRLDGVSLLALASTGDPLRRDTLFWHFPAYLQGGKRPDGTYSWRTTPVSVIRRGPLKLLHYYEDARWELFDLEHDLGERQNLVDALPAEADALASDLRQWLSETEAAMPLGESGQPLALPAVP